MIDTNNIYSIVSGVFDEIKRATTKFGSFPTAHHGYAVIKEELDEAWQEIKHGSVNQANLEMLQVASMAIRFIFDSHNFRKS